MLFSCSKIFFTPILLSSTLLISCNKLDIPKDTPSCIKAKIEVMEDCNDCVAANVKKYTFQGNTVYRVDPGSSVAGKNISIDDKDCNSIGLIVPNSSNDTVNGESFSKAIFIEDIYVKK